MNHSSPTRIYLDHNSTSPVDPQVADILDQAHRAFPHNPASAHHYGRLANDALETAKEGICRLLGAEVDSIPRDRLIVTSGGTEANNLAIRGPWEANPQGTIVVSAVEHPSVLGPANWLASQGASVRFAPVSPTGTIDPGELRDLVDASVSLVSVQAANHETGVLQPLDEIAAICRVHGTLLHVDAAQAVGKIPISFRASNIDALTLAPHKFAGPRGVGGLIVSPRFKLRAILQGGPQQLELRPGTESIASVIATRAALEIWEQQRLSRSNHLRNLRDRLETIIVALRPNAVIAGRSENRLPHTLNVAFPGVNRQALVIALDQAGIACSTGSACASGSSEPSPVLTAMGYPTNWLESAIRFSLGTTNTEAEIDFAAEKLEQILNRLCIVK